MALSLYQLKMALLKPRTVYMRRKEKDMDPASRAVFEQTYYAKSSYDLLRATIADPDVLVNVDLASDGTVVDVGAFSGDWSQKVVDRYGANVFAFEPAPPCYEATRRRFADDDRVQVFDYGLGGADFGASIALSGPGSSIYNAEGPAGMAEIQIRDIVAVLDEIGLEQIDVLKVNIEGGEYDLFDRLDDAGWLPRIDQILVQFHEWHPQAYKRRRRIRRALAKQHTEVWNFAWCWEYWRRA